MSFKLKKTTPGGEGKKIARRIVAALTAAVIVVGVFIAESRFLPPIAVNQLAELTNTRVKADSVTFSLNGSVVIRGLEIKPIEQLPYSNTILWARKVYVRFGLGGLFLLKPKLKKISVQDFTLDVQHDLDTNKWNVEAIKLATGKGGGALPAVRLRNGQINYSKVFRGKIETAVGIPINASLKRSKEIPDGYEFELATARVQQHRTGRIVGIYEPGHFALSGSISSEDVPAMQQTWSINEVVADYQYDKSDSFELELRIKDFTTKDRTAAPTIIGKAEALKKVGAASAIARMFEQYRLTGAADLELQAKGNLNELAKTKLKGVITCKDVSILYTVFPYFIEDITGSIDFSESAITINNLVGKHGNVDLTIRGGFDDFGTGTQGQVEIRSKNMVLDRDLYEALWPVQKKLWDDFEPNGVVEFDYTLRREPQGRNKYRLDVDLAGVNSTYKYFPYPLDNLTGNLVFDHNSIKVTNLNSRKLSHQININGSVIDTDTSMPKFDLVIDVNDIPLDDVLANALPQRERNLYNQFDPSGSGGGRILVRNQTQDPNRVDFTADLDFKDTVLRPPMLPLPITDINANGIFKPDSIEFRNFRGMYAGQPVSMEGVFEPTKDGKDLTYAMTLSSSDVRIDEGLLDLIPQRMRHTVNRLNPSGQIAYKARLNKQTEANDIDFEVDVECKGVTARPEVLGFVLNDITGEITVNKNSVVLDNIVSRAADAKSPSVRINGNIEITGEADGDEGIVAATVDLDANNFPVQDKRIYNLKAQLDYDAARKVWIADGFVGNFYDGKVTGQIKLAVEPNRTVSFELQSGFEGANLRKFLADRAKLPEDCNDGSCFSTGRMSGTVNVAGRANEIPTYLGMCRIEIENMQVGKISLVGKLLSLLELTEPSDYVFDRMLFDAYIKDGRLQFETLELSGAALTFAGTGWMDMTNKKLELTLAARGPRIAAIKEDVIGSLTTALSPGVLQVLVTGSAYEPKIDIKPLPVIGNTLELLGTKKSPSDKQ
jgi:hypothetical protein